MKIYSCILFTIILCVSAEAQDIISLYRNPKADIESRIDDVMSRLTLEEKVSMVSAQSKFSSPGVPRLGIPEIWMSDGPFGIREENLWDEWKGAGHTNDSCTANPNLTCLAATWNREMAAKYGTNLGEEARYRGKTVLLAPGVNIFRTPLCGRNFEYMGEDPYLASEMAVPYIQNIQKEGVAACVKHFALNNQEAHRHKVNVVVDDRALREIYLPAFEAAVKKAGVWAVMGAYNRYKGEFCCENQYLLNDILKGEWKFDGVVISDWGGVTNTEQSVKNGLDLEFGTWTNGLTEGRSDAYASYYMADAYLDGIRKGNYSENELNDKVRRILRLIFRTTMSGNSNFGSFASEEHFNTAKEIASEGIVLLKNESHILPLNLSKIKKILVVGDNATAKHASGGGSMYLKTKYETTVLESLMEVVDNRAHILYSRGYKPCGPTDDMKEIIELRTKAVELAKDVDLVIFVGGHNRWGYQDCEGLDKVSYNLPFYQEELIKALAVANSNLVVTLISGSAVAMPWLDNSKAVLYGWYGGSEGGNAIADVLVGKTNPSGKLPFTIAEKLEDYPPHYLNIYDVNNTGDVFYEESIFVGYRWFDKQHIRPLFPFGYGLSYTDFKIGKPKYDTNKICDNNLSVMIPVTNKGKCRGAEVVQLYISDIDSSLPRPVKELKDFKKIWLEPGETQNIEFVISEEMLRFYDPERNGWKSEPGKFKACIGTSSRDIVQKFYFELE